MPPTSRNKSTFTLTKYLNRDYIKKLLIDPQYLLPTCILLFLWEIVLNIYIIEKVNYTEIDWRAYMQEVEGFLNGTLDYSQLKGDTGPLVYPAGFVYIYSVFYYITTKGTNIHLAQYLFLLIYLCQILLTYRILIKTTKIPPYALIISTCTSYRVHSIYVLRLFNDPIAVLLFYISLNLFISNYWYLGSVFYSLAVSVKMNILLYSPILLIAYLTNLTMIGTIKNLLICGLLQLLLGLPFIYTNIFTYIKGSFDLGRIFEHKWTVNYRFLPIDLFENRLFHISLLILHIVLLGVFVPIFLRYFRSYAKLKVVVDDLNKQITNEKKKRDEMLRKENEKLTKKQRAFLKMFEDQLKHKNDNSNDNNDEDNFDSDLMKLERNMNKITQLFVLPFFVGNFIGVMCARSLHYQFYCWYYHSLLYLVFSTTFSKPSMFLLLGIVEYCWNVYPSTNLSSLLLHFCHVTILVGVYRTMKN